jgi:DnaJ-class molecular chaperone
MKNLTNNIQCPKCIGIGQIKMIPIICKLCDGYKCITCNSTGLEVMPYIKCFNCDGLGIISK